MSYFNINVNSSDAIVANEFKSQKAHSSSYQTEAELEQSFIEILKKQGYEYLPHLHQEEDLIKNLRQQLEKLNHYHFSDNEWKRFFEETIANKNFDVIKKTEIIQKDYRQSLECDDGSHRNIILINKEQIQNNYLQIINQYQTVNDNDNKNRYDVTILVNGLPLIQIELKKRGVSIKEAFNQIKRYQKQSFDNENRLFQYLQIFIISNGTETKYFSNTLLYNNEKNNDLFVFTNYWSDANNKLISDLEDFTVTFLQKRVLLSILTKYCVLTCENELLVMRPYQIAAAERIINRIKNANNDKKFGTIDSGGYIWHATGSGKTLTSFKVARDACEIPFIDKVFFVVDRRDLDYQTIKEYDRYQKGAAIGNKSTDALKKNIESDDAEHKILITTIQKLNKFITLNKPHPIYDKQIVIIFDECHRSQFGRMHDNIIGSFKKYYLFGFTGTPIFLVKETLKMLKNNFKSTELIFGDQLHNYNITNAINDGNVLPFKVDYVETVKKANNVVEEKVYDIDREKVFIDPRRIANNTRYILENFNKKTYRENQYFDEKILINKKRYFNAILATSSIMMAQKYYSEFQRQINGINANPEQKIKVGIIYSCADNDNIFDDEELFTAENLDQSSKEFLKNAIDDYNAIFKVNYEINNFHDYYKDISRRMKNVELDLLIVVNMFLTGFNAPRLNTLWIDKNLEMHNLIQTFSRTNRIFNEIKKFGNIICFRDMRKKVNDAITIFGDKNTNNINNILLRDFNDYYYGYDDQEKGHELGYVEIVNEFKRQFPISSAIEGEQKQKNFINLFNIILRKRNFLSSFADFTFEKKLFSERDYQDYLGKYNNLKACWRSQKKMAKIINEDVIFENELIEQNEINVDYILTLIKKKYQQPNELVILIQKICDAFPRLRSKKMLILKFIDEEFHNQNDVSIFLKLSEINEQFYRFCELEKKKDLKKIIDDEHLDEEKTKKVVVAALENGSLEISGKHLDEIMPKITYFGSDIFYKKRAEINEKISNYLETYKDLCEI